MRRLQRFRLTWGEREEEEEVAIGHRRNSGAVLRPDGGRRGATRAAVADGARDTTREDADLAGGRQR
jgi:hypothetical protein